MIKKPELISGFFMPINMDITGSTPPGSCSVYAAFIPELRFAPTSRDKHLTGLCTLNPIGF